MRTVDLPSGNNLLIVIEKDKIVLLKYLDSLYCIKSAGLDDIP